MIQEIELLSCRYDDACLLFNCEGADEAVIRQLAEKSHAKNIVLSHGSNDVLGWDGKQLLRAAPLEVQIIDRIGAGDALAAGILYGWLM